MDKGTIDRLFKVLEQVDPPEREELIDDWTVRFGPYNPIFEETDQEDHMRTLLLVKNTTRSYWKNVYLMGDSFGWDIPTFQFSKVKQSNWWYAEFIRPDAARLHYALAPNDPGIPITGETRTKRRKSWIVDPRNPDCVQEGITEHSILTYPNFQETRSFEAIPVHYNDVYLRNQLDGKRKAKIAVINHEEEHPEKLVITHGGKAFSSIMGGDKILSQGVKERDWPSIGLLTLDSPISQRKREYGGRYGYPEYFKKVIVPSAEHYYGQSFDPQDIILMGTSLGGWAMLDILAQQPDVADNLILQSCPFWWPDQEHGRYIGWFETEELPVTNLYLDVGIYETGRKPMSTYESNIEFVRTIQGSGVNLMARELMMGHRHNSWSWALPSAFDFIFNNTKDYGPRPGQKLQLFK